MKTKMIYLFILTLILSSCQEDKIDFAENVQEVTLSIGSGGNVSTRAEGTSFDIGDKIGIYIVRHQPDNTPVLKPSGNYADNKCYKVTSGANLLPNSENDKIYASESGYKYSIYAYYPYDDAITDPTNMIFEIKGDQTDIKRLKNSDFMMSQVLNMDLNKPVNLNFKRKLSYVHVFYNKNPEGIKPNSVGTVDSYYRSKINLQTGVVEKAKHDYLSNLNAYKYAEDSKQYHYCLILPSYNFEDRAMFQVDLNGKCYYYTAENFVLHEGAKNVINLTGTKRRVTCSAVSDHGVGGSIICKSEMYVLEGNSCTVSAYLYSGYAFDGWYKNDVLVSKDLEYTFIVSDDVHLEARFYACYNINLYTNLLGNSGLKYVKGGGKYRPGETCYLKAEINSGVGYTFTGWFVNGKLMSRHWWLAFQPNKDLNVEARFEKVHYDFGWDIQEVTFPATSGIYYWEHTYNTATSYAKDEEANIHCIEIFFVEDSSYYEEPFYSKYGTFEMLKIEIKSLDLSRTLAATSGTTGMLRYQNINEPGYHVQRSVRYKYVSQRNRPVKGKMYMRLISYKAHQLDVEPYYP